MSPFAYTLFLTHLFSFTFFEEIYLRYFPTPDFFRLSGVLYLAMVLLMAVVVSIVLKTVWSRITDNMQRIRQDTGIL
jgi:peptidoglycan/LPS O-acetylase OafA/YrhL